MLSRNFQLKPVLSLKEKRADPIVTKARKKGELKHDPNYLSAEYGKSCRLFDQISFFVSDIEFVEQYINRGFAFGRLPFPLRWRSRKHKYCLPNMKCEIAVLVLFSLAPPAQSNLATDSQKSEEAALLLKDLLGALVFIIAKFLNRIRQLIFYYPGRF